MKKRNVKDTTQATLGVIYSKRVRMSLVCTHTHTIGFQRLPVTGSNDEHVENCKWLGRCTLTPISLEIRPNRLVEAKRSN